MIIYTYYQDLYDENLGRFRAGAGTNWAVTRAPTPTL
jgi:hypothetical protein